MAQSNKPKVNKPSHRGAIRTSATVRDKKPLVYSSSKKADVTLFSSIDGFLEKKSKILLILIFGISTLFSLLLFQARMDTGGDDSGYILRAFDFIHKGIFPSYQGPLYPLVLSIFVSFLGIKIVFLKFLSVIFNFISLLFLYKAFKGRIPAFVLFSTLLLTVVNSYILNYASLTYNEPFFMVLQYVFFYYFFKLQDSLKLNTDDSLKSTWPLWLPVGLFVFLMTSTRNISISCLAGLVLYFIVRRQYKYIIHVTVAFLAFEIPVTLIEKIFWHSTTQWSSQGDMLLLKNPYNAADGRRHFADFFQDFFQNNDLYLSKRFYQIIGLKSERDVDTNSWVTFFTVLFLFFSIYRIIKSKNWYLLMAAGYLLSMAGATFIVLQTRWDQPRMILIYIPLLLMLFLYGLYDLCKKAPWGVQMLVFLIVPVIFIFESKSTIKKSKENLPILSKNLRGDIFYGFTPDWVNYLKMSQWCGNLPKDSLVACRKGPMSSVYANGREFFSVSKTDNIDGASADSVISFLRKNHVRYILLAKLRLNPTNPDAGYINTLDRVIYPIYKKYPQKIKPIRQEGNSEDAQLYEILY